MPGLPRAGSPISCGVSREPGGTGERAQSRLSRYGPPFFEGIMGGLDRCWWVDRELGFGWDEGLSGRYEVLGDGWFWEGTSLVDINI